FKANADGRGDPLVVETCKGWDALLTKLSWCLVTLYSEDERFAFVAKYGMTSTPVAPELFATLSATGIEIDFVEITPLPPGAATVGRFFKLRSDEEGWLPQLIVRDAMGRIALPTLYVEDIGYQQNRVSGDFYDEFQSGEYVCSLERVRRIH